MNKYRLGFITVPKADFGFELMPEGTTVVLTAFGFNLFLNPRGGGFNLSHHLPRLADAGSHWH